MWIPAGSWSFEQSSWGLFGRGLEGGLRRGVAGGCSLGFAGRLQGISRGLKAFLERSKEGSKGGMWGVVLGCCGSSKTVGGGVVPRLIGCYGCRGGGSEGVPERGLMGFEKGLSRSSVLGAVRALKMHGGGPAVVAGRPLDAAYRSENLELLAAGCCNLAKHVENAKLYGVSVVVAINRFATDSDAELDLVRTAALEAGAHAVNP